MWLVFFGFLLIEGTLSYADLVHAKLVHPFVEPSTLEANKDCYKVVKNNDAIKVELIGVVTNINNFVEIHSTILLVDEIFITRYACSATCFLFHTTLLVIQMDQDVVKQKSKYLLKYTIMEV